MPHFWKRITTTRAASSSVALYCTMYTLPRRWPATGRRASERAMRPTFTYSTLPQRRRRLKMIERTRESHSSRSSGSCVRAASSKSESNSSSPFSMRPPGSHSIWR